MLDFVPRSTRSMEAFLLALAARLRANGWRSVHVFAGQPSEGFRARLRELESPYHLASFQPTWRTALSLGRELRRYHADILQVSFMSPFGLALPLLRCAAGSRSVVVADHSSGPATRRAGISKLLACGRGVLAGAYIDRVITVSEFIRKRDVERMHLAPEKMRVVYNGIDVQRFSPRPSAKSSHPVVAYAGQLIRQKGVMTLLEAVKRLQDGKGPAFRVLIAGRGRDEAALRLFARRQALTNVEFLGHIDGVQRLFALADVVVVPSEWDEAFGFVVAEAMACGACVLASDAGAIPEVVGSDGDAGCLFRRKDAGDLAEKLRNLLANEALRRSMGTQARRRIADCFTIDRMVGGYVGVYEELVPR